MEPALPDSVASGRAVDMNVALAMAGLTFVILAIGHAAIGRRWVLPSLTKEHLPGSPFGSPSFTLGMLRFTGSGRTLLLAGFATLMMLLAAFPDSDPRVLLLRWVSSVWAAAMALACWQARRRLSDTIRFPVPFLFL